MKIILLQDEKKLGKKGDIIEADGKQTVLAEDVPAGHKVLLKDVKAGEDIIKYGYPIGHALKEHQ